VLHVADVDAHDEAVLAGDPQAFHHLRRRTGEVRHLRDHARRRPNPQDGREGVAERARVHTRRVAGDGALFLQAPEPVRDGGRREPDAAAELGEAQASISLELFDQKVIYII